MIEELRGSSCAANMVDLAVAAVPGAAFGAVVTSFVEDLLKERAA